MRAFDHSYFLTSSSCGQLADEPLYGDGPICLGLCHDKTRSARVPPSLNGAQGVVEEVVTGRWTWRRVSAEKKTSRPRSATNPRSGWMCNVQRGSELTALEVAIESSLRWRYRMMWHHRGDFASPSYLWSGPLTTTPELSSSEQSSGRRHRRPRDCSQATQRHCRAELRRQKSPLHRQDRSLRLSTR